MYIIFYLINEAKQQQFLSMTPYQLSLVNSETFIKNYNMEELPDSTKFI